MISFKKKQAPHGGSLRRQRCRGAGSVPIAGTMELAEIIRGAMPAAALPVPFRFLQKNISMQRKSFFPGSRSIAVKGDIFLPSTLSFLTGRLECVASNPPYLSSVFQPEASFDPPQALFGGGEAGMCFICRLLPLSYRLLKSGGLCIIEHGSEQSGEVFSLFSRTGFKDVETVKDLSGRDRFTRGVK